MAVHDVVERHPCLEISNRVEGRVRQDRAPEPEIEAGRNTTDLPITQAATTFFRLPLAVSPEKKGPKTSRRIQATTA